VRSKKYLIAAAILSTVIVGASGCSSSSTSSDAAVGATAGGVTTITVGATFPADDILNYVEQSQAAAAGLDIKVTSFTDYTTPNTALEDGSLDANLYQHLPFLNNFNTNNGTHIAPVGKVYFPALALYSKTIKSVDDIKDGATISIPNDPTNELRSLNLLQKAGLITLNEGATGVVGDIATNPKNLVFQELDAATLPRALDENVAGIANLSFALPAGLTGDQQILTEDVNGTLYTNLLATKEGHENDPAIQKLYELLTSKETQDWITSEYKGLVIPSSGPAS
jgi:D-methionine transport system substrate-binding protein